MAAVEKRSPAELARDLATLRDGAALSPLAERMILSARGTDRATFLQGMLSNDVQRLAPGQGTHALLLTEQGRVVADLYVFACSDATWLETPAAARERVREALERFVVADDVEFEEPALAGLALRGDGALDVLSRILPQHASEIAALPECGHLQVEHDGGSDLLARVREYGRDGFRVWSADGARADALAVALLAAGASPVEPDAIEIHRVATGWAQDGDDYDAQTLAAEIPSLARAVSYRKGCYLGQEVMERIAARGHVNWLLVHLAGEAGTAFVAGAVVKDGDAEVGRVTSAALLPEHDRRVVALARVRAAAAEPGRRLLVLDGDRATPVEVGSIPVES